MWSASRGGGKTLGAKDRGFVLDWAKQERVMAGGKKNHTFKRKRGRGHRGPLKKGENGGRHISRKWLKMKRKRCWAGG